MASAEQIAASTNPYTAAAYYGKEFLKGVAERKAQQQAIAQEQAYADFLNQLAGKYESKLGEQQKLGEEQFLTEMAKYEEALPELQQYIEQVKKQATPEQEQARRQMEADLARGGVRGGQAATIQARETGKMGADLSTAVQEMAMKEAQERRAQQLQYKAPYFSEKGLYPYKQLSSGYGQGMKEAQTGYQKQAASYFKKPTASGTSSLLN